MKIITTKTAKKFNPEYGWVEQVKFFIFGFYFWTEIHAIEILPQVTEPQHLADLEEMAMYQEWRAKMKTMRLSDDEFLQIINTRF